MNLQTVDHPGEECACCQKEIKEGSKAHYILTDIHGEVYRDEVRDQIPDNQCLDWLPYGRTCYRKLTVKDQYKG